MDDTTNPFPVELDENLVSLLQYNNLSVFSDKMQFVIISLARKH